MLNLTLEQSNRAEWAKFIKTYDRFAEKAFLPTMAIITGIMTGMGYLTRFDEPSLSTYFVCALLMLGTGIIANAFWKGAWQLPLHTSGNLIAGFAVVSVLGFLSLMAVSVPGNMLFLFGEQSEATALEDQINNHGNAARPIAAHFGALEREKAKLEALAQDARALQDREKAGAGPTGSGGAGPVSNSYGNAAGRYTDAAGILETVLTTAAGRMSDIQSALDGMREVRSDRDIGQAERTRQFRSLERDAIDAMSALRALDPGGTLRAAADVVAQGIPEPARAPATSRDIIASIRAEMMAIAAQMRIAADQLDTVVIEIPAQFSATRAENLWDNAFRFPALAMAAILFDACGFLAIFFRTLAYWALRRASRTDFDRYYDHAFTIADLELAEILALRAETMRETMVDLQAGRQSKQPMILPPERPEENGQGGGDV